MKYRIIKIFKIILIIITTLIVCSCKYYNINTTGAVEVYAKNSSAYQIDTLVIHTHKDGRKTYDLKITIK